MGSFSLFASVSIVDLVSQTGPVGLSVLLILLVLSVVSWALMIYKFKKIKEITGKNKKFRKAFRKAESLKGANDIADRYNHSTLSGVFKVGYEELMEQNRRRKKTPGEEGKAFHITAFERALSRGKKLELEALRKNLGLLASVGSVSPFIGLFGTVWGIISAFQEIGLRGSANLAVVAPGISEALVATAAGLFAAIPAVVGYNYFNEKIRGLSSDIDEFCLELINIVEKLLEES